MFYLCPIPKQFVDHSGLPCAHGKVFVYLTGDSQLAAVYADAEGESLMANPAELDANGCWQCFVPSDIALDYIVQDAGGNVIAKFVQVIPGTGEGSGQGVTKAYVDRQDSALRTTINALDTLLEAETTRAAQAETQARSTVSGGIGIGVTPSAQPDGHTDFQIKNRGVVSIDIRSPGETLNIQHRHDDQSGKDTILVEGQSIEIDENLDTESQNPVENRAVAEAMNGKQDQLTEMTDQEINDLINSLGDL